MKFMDLRRKEPDDDPDSIRGESLLKLARSGTDDALGQLVEFYRPYLLKLANGAVDSDLRPKLPPSDVVQCAMFSATGNFAEFRGAGEPAFRLWLVTILKNQLVDGVRRYRSLKRDVGREVPVGLSNCAATTESPSAIAATREDVDRLLRSIDRLDPESRKTIQLRYVLGLSFQAIGEQVGLSCDAARRRWLRAVVQLNDRLRDE